MSVRKLVLGVILLEILGIATVAKAQGILPGGKTIGERLDDINRTVFGGLFGENKDSQDNKDNKDNTQNNKQAPRPVPGSYSSAKTGDSTGSQGVTIIKPSTANQQKTADESPARTARLFRSDSNVSSPGASMPDNRPGRRYFEDMKVQDNSETPENTLLTPIASPGQSSVAAPNKNSSGSAELSEQSNTISPPLYERLQQFRRSAFDDPAKKVSLDDPAKKVSLEDPAKKVSDSPSPSTSITSDNPSTPGLSSAADKPLTARSESSQPAASKAVTVYPTGRPTPAKRPAGAESFDHPVIAQQTSPTIRMDAAIAPGVQSTAIPDLKKEAGKLPVNRETPATKEKESDILFAHKGPVLGVETQGPRKIAVGKESTYEVKIINSGDVAAEELIVFVNLPEWADVIGSEASSGSAQAGPPGKNSPLQWKVAHLGAKSQEKLVLRIVPRQSRPFDLAVRWEFKPAASQTMIEVQEPKLEMQLEGPREVYYGKKEVFRLKLFNSGSGNAEGVAIKFVPVGAGENVAAAYELGVLSAGEDKVIEVELTARQSGMLVIQIEAKAEAGVHVELAEKVLVRRAGLEIGLDGPKLQFVGTTATYALRVRNPGNAPAKNINFTVALPAGLKYVGGIEGARTESNSNKLLWTAETINPEAVQTFAIKCVPSASGVNHVEIAATADDDLTASATAVTQVESAANLVLDVKDPGVPIPVGEEATYEIRVLNRGTKDAEGIEVIGYFSRGIEPVGAEGGANRLGPGQVVYAPVPTLAPGGEIVLKIHARAETPGNHIFRAEMHCKALGSRLVSEEATLYYQDALSIPQNSQVRPPLDRVIR